MLEGEILKNGRTNPIEIVTPKQSLTEFSADQATLLSAADKLRDEAVCLRDEAVFYA